MKRLGLLILVLALVLGGIFFLNPGGGGDFDLFEEDAGPGFEEAVGLSTGLTEDVGQVAAGDAVANPLLAGIAEASRSSLDTGTVGEIHGRVLDLLSEPVAGAKIFLYRIMEARRRGPKAPILARAESDERGFFKMRGLALQGYNLRVSAEGRAETRVGVELSLRYPKRLGLILRLQEGRSLDGVVVDKVGKAVPEAWVVASIGGGETNWQEVRSDKEGSFSFSSVPFAKLHVLAWAEGHTLGLTQVDAGKSEPLRVELPDAGPFKIVFSLAEQGKDGSSKPGDVSVNLLILANNRTLPLPEPLRNLRVPTEGHISSRGLREGTYHLYLDSEEVALEKTWHRQSLNREKPEAKVKLGWAAALALEGRLVFKNGQPASRISLQTWTQNRRERLSVESDKEGRFRFPRLFRANAQTYISLADPGFIFETKKNKTYWVQMKPAEKGKVFTLVPAALISGRVVDEKGGPVPGARVWLHLPDRNWGGYGQTKTDEKGEFRFSASRGSKKPLLLDASYDSMYCARPLLLEIKEQVSREGLLLRLAEGSWIEGTVSDDKGVGIVAVNVWASFIPKPRPKGAKKPGIMGWRVNNGIGFNPVRSRSARTNREGKFRIRGITPGSWRVSARKEGRLKRGVDPVLQLRQGENRSGLALVLDPGLSIEGRLLTDSGKPLVGAMITARYDGKLAKGQSGGRANAPTGIDGRFSLAGLRPGKFKLSTQLPYQMQNELGLRKPGPDGKRPMRGRTRIETSVMAGIKDYRWLFPLPRFGEVRARFAQSGKPLQRIQVDIRDGKRTWSFDLPVVRGAVSMKRVLTGSYDLTFRNPRYSNLMTKVQVNADQVADLGLLNLVDLEQIEGRVTDQQGQAIAGVWISLDSRVGRLWPKYNISEGPEQFEGRVLTQTDARGRFFVPCKGRLRVYGFKPGYAPGTLSYSRPGAKQAGGSRKIKSKRSPTKKGAANKEPILILKRAGEISVQAPTSTKGKRSRWHSKLTRVPDAPPNPGKRAPRPWSRSMALQPGRPIRFLGLRPGLYRLEASDFMKNRRYTKQSVPGESYYEEFLIQIGTNRLIRIP